MQSQQQKLSPGEVVSVMFDGSASTFTVDHSDTLKPPTEDAIGGAWRVSDGVVQWRANANRSGFALTHVTVGRKWLQAACELEVGTPKEIIWDYCQDRAHELE